MTEQSDTATPAEPDEVTTTGADPDAGTVDEAAAVAAARNGRRGGKPSGRRATAAAADAATMVSDPPASSEAVEAAAAATAAAGLVDAVVEGPVVDNGTVAASLPSVQRDTFAVLDPNTLPGAVADTSPYAATTGNRDGYVRAPVDAHELVYPTGCKTPTTRKAWMAGQWVRADVYRAWGEQQPGGVPEPMPAAPPAGHEELVRGVMDVNGGGFTAPVNF